MNNDKSKTESQFRLFHHNQSEPGLFLLTSTAAVLLDRKSFYNYIDVLQINMKMAEKIAKRLNLTYLVDTENTGNLCMANTEEVLTEFRDICRAQDLRRYVIAMIRSSEGCEQFNRLALIDTKIAFPESIQKFWEVV